MANVLRSTRLTPSSMRAGLYASGWSPLHGHQKHDRMQREERGILSDRTDILSYYKQRVLRTRDALRMIVAPPVKARGWGVVTPIVGNSADRIAVAGWHARMSSWFHR